MTQDELKALQSDDLQLEQKILLKMQIHFIKKNESTFKDISVALNNGDFKLAHRITHSLKGNAGQIGRTKLQKIAQNIENKLKQDEIPSIDLMKDLQSEITKTYNDLMPIFTDADFEDDVQLVSYADDMELLIDLKKLLENKNVKCLDYLNNLARLPGTAELIRRIEDYDFSVASEILGNMIENNVVSD